MMKNDRIGPSKTMYRIYSRPVSLLLSTPIAMLSTKYTTMYTFSRACRTMAQPTPYPNCLANHRRKSFNIVEEEKQNAGSHVGAGGIFYSTTYRERVRNNSFLKILFIWPEFLQLPTVALNHLLGQNWCMMARWKRRGASDEHTSKNELHRPRCSRVMAI